MQHLVRKIKLRHVIEARVHVGKIISARRNICRDSHRSEIGVPVKAGIDALIGSLILFDELPERT